MKKTVSLLLAVLMAFSLVACGNSAGNATDAPVEASKSPVETTPPVEGESWKPTKAITIVVPYRLAAILMFR